MSGMGSVAAMENTPSLKPGGRYPGTGVRAACLRQLDGIISFASAGRRRQPPVEAGPRSGGRAARAWPAGSAAGMPGGSGHAMRQVWPPGRAFRLGLCWGRLLP